MTSQVFAVSLAFILLASIISSNNATSFEQEMCSNMGNCQAMVSYTSFSPTAISELAKLFQIDAESILGVNNFDPKDSSSTISPNETIKVPVACSCVGGMRRGNSTTYSVIAGDFLTEIAQKFGGLVTYQEIASANSISNPDIIQIGQKLVIPYPCACHDNLFKGNPSVYLTYVVREGNTVSGLAKAFDVSENAFTELNRKLINGTQLNAADKVQLPIPECVTDFGLRVPAEGYARTGNGCVQCSCYSKRLCCVKTTPSTTSCSSYNVTECKVTPTYAPVGQGIETEVSPAGPAAPTGQPSNPAPTPTSTPARSHSHSQLPLMFLFFLLASFVLQEIF